MPPAVPLKGSHSLGQQLHSPVGNVVPPTPPPTPPPCNRGKTRGAACHRFIMQHTELKEWLNADDPTLWSSILPVPRPTWASPTSINTQDSFSSRWPGDYSPSVPTPPPSSADLLPKLYLDRWHSGTALNWPGVFPSTLLTCGCRWPPLPFHLSFPAILTCPPPATSVSSLPPTLTELFVWFEQADSTNTCKCFNPITVCSYRSAINANPEIAGVWDPYELVEPVLILKLPFLQIFFMDLSVADTVTIEKAELTADLFSFVRTFTTKALGLLRRVGKELGRYKTAPISETSERSGAVRS